MFKMGYLPIDLYLIRLCVKHFSHPCVQFVVCDTTPIGRLFVMDGCVLQVGRIHWIVLRKWLLIDVRKRIWHCIKAALRSIGSGRLR